MLMQAIRHRSSTSRCQCQAQRLEHGLQARLIKLCWLAKGSLVHGPQARLSKLCWLAKGRAHAMTDF